MASKTWYVTNSIVDSVHQEMSETSPGSDATSSPTYGWIVARIVAGNYSSADAGTERASSTFSATVQPDGSIDTSANAGDCWRTTDVYTGSFAAGTWTFQMGVIAVTNGGTQDGRAGFRLFHGTNADGSGATEVTSSAQVGSTVTNLTTSTQQTSSVAPSLSAFDVSGEYLFVQVGWEITGAGGNNNCDIIHRVGTTASLVTSPNFSATVSGAAALDASAALGVAGSFLQSAASALATAATVAALATTIWNGAVSLDGSATVTANATVEGGQTWDGQAALTGTTTLGASGTVILSVTRTPGDAVSSGDGTYWRSPLNALTSNDLRAFTLLFSLDEESQNLVLTEYGFETYIPDGSTIEGIGLGVEHMSGDQFEDKSIRLLKAGTPDGQDKAILGIEWPSPEAVQNYGGFGDLWQTTWSASDVTDTAFGASIRGVNGSGSGAYGYVDCATITVYYVSSGVVSGKAALTGSATLAPNGSLEMVAAGALAASGTVEPLAALDLAGASSLAGSAALAPLGGVLLATGAALDGAATLVASGTVETGGFIRDGQAALTGAGTLAPAGTVALGARASLAGAGTLAPAGGLLLPGQAALSGAGTLAPTGTVLGAIRDGAASLVAVGSLSALASFEVRGATVLAGSASLAPAPAVRYDASAALAGVATLVATGAFGPVYHPRMTTVPWGRGTIFGTEAGPPRSRLPDPKGEWT